MDGNSFSYITFGFGIGSGVLAAFWGIFMMWINTKFTHVHEKFEDIHEDVRLLEDRLHKHEIKDKH